MFFYKNTGKERKKLSVRVSLWKSAERRTEKAMVFTVRHKETSDRCQAARAAPAEP